MVANVGPIIPTPVHNNSTTGSAHNFTAGEPSRQSRAQNCDHRCTVVTLAIVIPLLTVLVASMAVYVFFVRKRLAAEKQKREKAIEVKALEMRKLGSREDGGSEEGSVLGNVDERSIDGVMRDVELGVAGVGAGEGKRENGMKWWRR